MTCGALRHRVSPRESQRAGAQREPHRPKHGAAHIRPVAADRQVPPPDRASVSGFRSRVEIRLLRTSDAGAAVGASGCRGPARHGRTHPIPAPSPPGAEVSRECSAACARKDRVVALGVTCGHARETVQPPSLTGSPRGYGRGTCRLRTVQGIRTGNAAAAARPGPRSRSRSFPSPPRSGRKETRCATRYGKDRLWSCSWTHRSRFTTPATRRACAPGARGRSRELHRDQLPLRATGRS